MNEPLVSVIIPFYSGVKWLEAALESVKTQTYKNIEIIIVNDGSKEDINSLNRIFSSNVEIIFKENGGPASARNAGIKSAKGKYIAFLDSDDLWISEKLEKQINFMENNKYVWTQHSYQMFWEENKKTKIIYTENLKDNVLKDTFISFKVQTSCVVVCKDVLDKNDIKFPLDKRYGQDMVFFRELARLYPLGYVDGILSKFRIRGSNAGFRSKVQLADKAETWNNIKLDSKILRILPINVILGYKIAWAFNIIFSIIDNRIIRSEKNLEFLAKGFYLLPYIFIRTKIKK